MNALKLYEHAIDCFDQVLRHDPNFADSLNGKGCALHGLKRYAEALVYFNRAIKADAKFAVPVANKANCLISLNWMPQADACYDKAIQLDSNYANKDIEALTNYEEEERRTIYNRFEILLKQF